MLNILDILQTVVYCLALIAYWTRWFTARNRLAYLDLSGSID